MSDFNNEYVSKLNRAQTNAYVSKFLELLLKKIMNSHNLMLVIPPIFTSEKNNFIVNNNFRTIDFDNAFSKNIFKVIDFLDKWLYLYIRQSNVQLNSGIVCFNNQVFRDADIENFKRISIPCLSFVVSIQRLDYSNTFLINQSKKIISLLNEIFLEIQIDNFKSDKSIKEFKEMNLTTFLKNNKKMSIDDILIHQTAENPILLSNFNDSKLFKEIFPYAENNFIHSEMNNIFLQFYSQKNIVLDFFNICLQPTYEKLKELDFYEKEIYISKLSKVYKNSEWTYIVNINLANILLWLLDKQHYSEIFSGPFGDEFYENILNNERDVL
ncbi:hypothetical protein [Mycoplasmoides pirum]|uniref:hypothetical protein n=1 Tax=Mycoplasmoides pirum TaxID=2122 RepID=UPI00048010A7|nr:hypothetical protein [Mycoplasmoides pirum]